MKDDKEKKFKATQKELNQKIESIMGPTSSGEEPVKDAREVYKAPDLDRQTTKLTGKSAEPAKIASTDGDTPPVPGTSEQDKALPVKKAEEPEAKPEGETTSVLDPVVNDEETEKAVDDIAAYEADEVLEAEDEKVAAAFADNKKTFSQKVKDFFRAWWENPKARWTTIIILLLTVIGLIVYPTTRYFLLNTAGVRSKASLRVLDDSTQQPLKNVHVKIAGQESITDDNGQVSLPKLKLGRTNLVIQRRAFAEVNKKITMGWGNNPLGEFKLTPVGLQYAFTVHDFLSNKPIEKAEASNGDASAFSDKDGKILLTLDKTDEQSITVTLKAKDYRDEKRTFDANGKNKQDIAFVPARKHVFVTKRSGKFDVYKIDVDGTHEELVLAGTGTERDDMALAPHPSGNIAALISTRDNAHNTDGFLLSTLTLLDLDNNKTTSLGQSERVQIIGWVRDKLVYAQIAAGASATNPKRHRLLAYNYTTGESKELAAANYFNDVLLVNGQIYYAPAASFQNGLDVSLFRINPDGSNKQVVTDKETWNIFRTDYDKLTVAVQQDWYEYIPSSQKLNKLSGAPANPKTRIYIESPDKKRNLWVDNRDGKGVLIAYDIDAKKENNLKTQSGLKYPVRWMNNSTAVYRINTEQETADYVISLDGGEPKKIKDVTNTAGIDKWFYY